MPATEQKIRAGAIVQGAPQSIQAAWRAVALLEARFNAALLKLDADATVTDTNYAALWGTAAAERAIVE